MIKFYRQMKIPECCMWLGLLFGALFYSIGWVTGIEVMYYFSFIAFFFSGIAAFTAYFSNF